MTRYPLFHLYLFLHCECRYPNIWTGVAPVQAKLLGPLFAGGSSRYFHYYHSGLHLSHSAFPGAEQAFPRGNDVAHHSSQQPAGSTFQDRRSQSDGHWESSGHLVRSVPGLRHRHDPNVRAHEIRRARDQQHQFPGCSQSIDLPFPHQLRRGLESAHGGLCHDAPAVLHNHGQLLHVGLRQCRVGPVTVYCLEHHQHVHFRLSFRITHFRKFLLCVPAK